MNNKKILIVGAGASGLVSAISSARAGKIVTLIEQGSKVSKKILASGNGKCNITNKNISINYFHSENPEFIKKILYKYDTNKIKKFFTSIGIEIVESSDGKMFPMSLQASSVAEILEYEVKKLGIKIVYNTTVIDVNKVKNRFEIISSNGIFNSDEVILANGSVASPQLGGNSSGYALATKLGHSLIPRYPSLVQLCSNDEWIKDCSGVKINSTVKLYANGEYITQKNGDILFTTYGVSGLAILDISREVSIRLANYDYCELYVNILPQLNKDKLLSLLLNNINKESNKPLTLWLQGFLNKKLIPIVIKESKIKAKVEKELNTKEIKRLIHTIKNLKISISDTRGFKGAEVSTGGINTKEVNPINMESKIVPNLFFTGEILDVDGDRGGFNFHFAWVSALRVAKV